MDTLRILQDIVERIFNGEIVPVRKKYQSLVADQLDSQGMPYAVADDETNSDRVCFRLSRSDYGVSHSNLP